MNTKLFNATVESRSIGDGAAGPPIGANEYYERQISFKKQITYLIGPVKML